MPKWKFEDDCLAPERRMRIDYNGLNPFKVCQSVRGVAEKVFQAGGSDMWERDFRWDNSGDPRTFYMRFYVSKDIDQHSKILVEVTIQGEQPADEKKNGKFTLFVGGKIVTEYDLDTAFKNSPVYKAFRWFYNLYFYGDIRRKYLTLCAELINKFVDELKDIYSIPKVV